MPLPETVEELAARVLSKAPLDSDEQRLARWVELNAPLLRVLIERAQQVIHHAR